MRLHESIQSINESISRVLQGFLPHLQWEKHITAKEVVEIIKDKADIVIEIIDGKKKLQLLRQLIYTIW
jgi:uncharacterized FlaG/YvyC family protein